MSQRTVFYVSDRTGLTAESLGDSVISQFVNVTFTQVTIPFVDNINSAQEAVMQINRAFKNDGAKPIVFSSIVSPEVKAELSEAKALILDIFNTFIDPLEAELGVKSTRIVGKARHLRDDTSFTTRMNAINYALKYDDGASVKGYGEADVVLVGVSRCGKTPTCLYMALQFGLKAANYPITEEDIDVLALPKPLRPFKDKIFGLTIDPKRLTEVREQRRPGSRYATLDQCIKEVNAVEELYALEQIPYIGSTNRSVEELATKVMMLTGLSRRIR